MIFERTTSTLSGDEIGLVSRWAILTRPLLLLLLSLLRFLLLLLLFL